MAVTERRIGRVFCHESDVAVFEANSQAAVDRREMDEMEEIRQELPELGRK